MAIFLVNPLFILHVKLISAPLTRLGNDVEQERRPDDTSEDGTLLPQRGGVEGNPGALARRQRRRRRQRQRRAAGSGPALTRLRRGSRSRRTLTGRGRRRAQARRFGARRRSRGLRRPAVGAGSRARSGVGTRRRSVVGSQRGVGGGTVGSAAAKLRSRLGSTIGTQRLSVGSKLDGAQSDVGGQVGAEVDGARGHVLVGADGARSDGLADVGSVVGDGGDEVAGVGDVSLLVEEVEHACDSMNCRRTGMRRRYGYIYMATPHQQHKTKPRE